jgi:hypothetical protein
MSTVSAMTHAETAPTTGQDDHYACHPNDCDVAALERDQAAEREQHEHRVAPFFRGASAARPELPGRVPGRAARIAAIRMLADWLTDNPDVPAPTDIMATWRIGQLEELDQATRYAAVISVADLLGAKQYGTEYGDRAPQADYSVADSGVHGVEITYRAVTCSDAYYDRSL